MGAVQGPDGREISYAAYIAPALLAVSAMNGAVYDSTWNVFFKMNFAKLFTTHPPTEERIARLRTREWAS